MKRGKLNKRGKSDASKLKAKLDAVFSEWIRRKDAVGNLAECVTCGKKDHWKRMQCGHFIPRHHLAGRFNEDNCHVQCAGCNVFKGGNYPEYAAYIVHTYGPERLDELLKLKTTIMRISTPEYEEKIAYYKEKLKKLDNGKR